MIAHRLLVYPTYAFLETAYPNALAGILTDGENGGWEILFEMFVRYIVVLLTI
jgi:hypothetical protein